MSPRVLGPSRRRNAFRALLGLALAAFGVLGMAAGGSWPLGLLVLAIGLWPLSMAVLIAFGTRAYELRLEPGGFEVYDLFGRLTHQVAWSEVDGLLAVGANAYAFTVVGWVCSPRRPRRGRWRWKRGTKADDGCLPDTYGMKAESMIELMWAYWDAGRPQLARGG